MDKKFAIDKQLLSMLFFPLTLLYYELLLRALAVKAPMDYHLLFIAVFSAGFGLFLWLLIGLIPSRKARLITTAVSTLLLALLFSVEYGVQGYFQTFFEFSTIFSMADDVVGQFTGEAINGFLDAIPFFLLTTIPMILLAPFHKYLVPDTQLSWEKRGWVLATIALMHGCTTIPMLLDATVYESDKTYFTSSYTANGSIPRFGVLTTVRLEATYGIFGLPEEEFIEIPIVPVVDEVVETTPEPTVYEYNVMDIDFAALSESSKDNTIANMHQYFAAVTPTQKNEYTGMFEGKNLIMLTCEAFTPYIIDPELTPMLYKMSTEGFVFNNFYQPDWTQSTTGGECAVMTGLIPTWVAGQYTLTASARNYLPFVMGHQFRELGYATRAYHNHHYAYYNRQLSHPNMGYDYKGIDAGLVLPHKTWPNSDVEMMEVTVQEYIDNYVNNGEKFHTYYMTVSGHTGYNWDGNSQSKKHREEVQHLEYSDTVKAYIACQLEVEYALQYIMERLEEAGIADDTVIALSADHFPYALTTPQYNELQPTPTNLDDLDHFRNGFLVWSSCMEEAVVIDAPASTIDIIPTLSNLFGLEYDSRLLSGRDLLSTNYTIEDINSPQPLVVFLDRGSGCSWISTVGQYNASRRTFTPAPGYEEYADNQAYLDAMQTKCKNMITMARNIIAKDYYAAVFPEKAAK